MKIFLTGGTGFIGSHFINEAHSHGHDIVALRRPGAHPRIQLRKEPIWLNGQLDEVVKDHFLGIDVLVHLASHTPNPPYGTIAECLYWNVFASLKLAEQAFIMGVQNYLVAGSCFEYGLSAQKHALVPGSTQLLPQLSYPTSKAAASIAFEGFAREKNVCLKNLKIFQVYGEGEQESRFWPSLKKAAIAGLDFPMTYGEQLRDFISVDEVARQILANLDFSDLVLGEPVTKHICTGEHKSLRDFAEYWWKKWGATGKLELGAIPYRDGEQMQIISATKPSEV